MKANYIVATVVLILLIAIGAGIYAVYKNRNEADTIDVSPLPVSSPLEGFNATATPASLGVNSQPISGESGNIGDNLQVVEPANGEYLTNPFRVRGYLKKSSADVQIAFYSENGEKIAESTVPCETTLDRETCEFSILFENINAQVKSGKVEAVSDNFSDTVSVNFN